MALNSASNCQTINIATSNKEESIQFLLSGANSGGSKRVPKIRWLYYYDNLEIVSVKASSLDAYLEERDFRIVIVDTEDLNTLPCRGAGDTLKLQGARSRVLAASLEER